MSVPARSVPRTERTTTRRPSGRTAPMRTPARTPARRPAPARTPARAASGRRVRVKRRPVLIPLAAVLGLLLFSIVAVSVVLAGSSMQIDAARSAVQQLTWEQRDLLRQRAELTSPGRIAEWAESHGMTLAETVQVLPMGGDR